MAAKTILTAENERVLKSWRLGAEKIRELTAMDGEEKKAEVVRAFYHGAVLLQSSQADERDKGRALILDWRIIYRSLPVQDQETVFKSLTGD